MYAHVLVVPLCDEYYIALYSLFFSIYIRGSDHFIYNCQASARNVANAIHVGSPNN